MKCDICGRKDPEINIQQVIGKNTRDIHICRKCACEKGIIDNDDGIEFSLSRLINYYLDRDHHKDHFTCEVCGNTLEDIRKNKRILCENCAVEFRKYISGLLAPGERTRPYHGRFPKKMHIVKDLFIDLEILKKDLDKAVQAEEYEIAAGIRDRIKQLGTGPAHE